MTLQNQEIALELVPNSYESLLEQATFARNQVASIQSINIPEMQSKSIKGHDAARFFLQQGIDAIPHFRTRERTLEDFQVILEELLPLGLQKVLLITGDPPKEDPQAEALLTPVQAIPPLKKKFPSLKFYVGIDPYRQSLKDEMDYCLQKLDAGADGFFSQPFFDPALLDVWLHLLQDTEFWVGLSPVTTDSFRRYWENVNRVIFPRNFSIDLESNCQQERLLLEKVEAAGQKAYLMPITVSIEEYIPRLFTL